MDFTHRSSTPRTDIIDTARHSRTITLDDAVDFLQRRDLLESCESEGVNGWPPFLVSGVRLGQGDFSAQASCGAAYQDSLAKESNGTTDAEQRLPTPNEHFVQPPNPTDTGFTRALSKPMSFSSLMKRMSITRRKRDTINAPISDARKNNPEHTETRGPRHSRLRRWFTRRLAKPKTPEPPVTSDSTNSVYNPEDLDRVCSKANGMTAGSSPGVDDPHSSKQSFKSTSTEPSPQKHSDTPYQSHNVETSFARDLLSRLDRWPSLPPDESSPAVPISLTRKHSNRSGADRSAYHVHFSSKADQLASTQSGPRCFLSDAALFQGQSTVRKYPNLIPISKEKPSYLSISVAAFGYYGHSREPWLVDDTKPFQPTNLSLSPSIASRKLDPNSTEQQPQLTSVPVPAKAQPISRVDASTDGPCNGKTKVRQDGLSLLIPNDLDKVASSSPSQSSHSESTSNRPRLRKSMNRTSTPDDHEHWQRSSLIMFAVAQASPRPKPSGAETETNGTTPVELQRNAFFETAPEEAVLGKAPNGHQHNERTSLVHEHSSPAANDSSDKDVNYFIRQVDMSQAAILSLVEQSERDLENEILDNEVSGLLRTAVGKARLLVAEKFAQFRGLCQQNIDWEKSKLAGETNEAAVLPTLLSDLDGFWAMVELQVTDVHKMFEDIELLRSNGWKRVDPPVSLSNGNSTKESENQIPSTIPPKKSRKKTIVKTSENTAARQKARERLESLKREMRSKKLSAETNGSGDGFLII